MKSDYESPQIESLAIMTTASVLSQSGGSDIEEVLEEVYGDI